MYHGFIKKELRQSRDSLQPAKKKAKDRRRQREGCPLLHVQNVKALSLVVIQIAEHPTKALQEHRITYIDIHSQNPLYFGLEDEVCVLEAKSIIEMKIIRDIKLDIERG